MRALVPLGVPSVAIAACVDGCTKSPSSDTSKSGRLALARLDGWATTREDG